MIWIVSVKCEWCCISRIIIRLFWLDMFLVNVVISGLCPENSKIFSKILNKLLLWLKKIHKNAYQVQFSLTFMPYLVHKNKYLNPSKYFFVIIQFWWKIRLTSICWDALDWTAEKRLRKKTFLSKERTLLNSVYIIMIIKDNTIVMFITILCSLEISFKTWKSLIM